MPLKDIGVLATADATNPTASNISIAPTTTQSTTPISTQITEPNIILPDITKVMSIDIVDAEGSENFSIDEKKITSNTENTDIPTLIDDSYIAGSLFTESINDIGSVTHVDDDVNFVDADGNITITKTITTIITEDSDTIIEKTLTTLSDTLDTTAVTDMVILSDYFNLIEVEDRKNADIMAYSFDFLSYLFFQVDINTNLPTFYNKVDYIINEHLFERDEDVRPTE